MNQIQGSSLKPVFLDEIISCLTGQGTGNVKSTENYQINADASVAVEKNATAPLNASPNFDVRLNGITKKPCKAAPHRSALIAVQVKGASPMSRLSRIGPSIAWKVTGAACSGRTSFRYASMNCEHSREKRQSPQKTC